MYSNRSRAADLINLGHLENTKGIRIFGLIGLVQLRQMEMIIDYENGEIHIRKNIEKEPSRLKTRSSRIPSAYTAVPIEFWNNKLVYPYNNGRQKLRLMIDSGAESNLLDSRLCR